MRKAVRALAYRSRFWNGVLAALSVISPFLVIELLLGIEVIQFAPIAWAIVFVGSEARIKREGR